MITPKEARLLALERKQARIGEILRGLKTDVAGARQGIWDAWGDVGAAGAAPTPTPTPTPGPTIFPCCNGITPNSVIGVTDSIWGAGTLTLSTTTWDGWLSGLAWPGAGACGAATIAVYYSYDPVADQLNMQWLTDATSHCPVASTPAFITPPAGQVYATTGLPVVYNCDATPVTSTSTTTGSAAETLLRTGHASEVVTVSFSGTTAPHTVYAPPAFCGGGSCVSTSLTLVDSLYGNATIVWNGTNWVGTHTGIAYPGGGGTGCGAATIDITYTLLAASGNITISIHATAGCPTAGAPNSSTTYTGIFTCSGTVHVIATNATAAGAFKNLRAGAASQTFRVDF